jgi:hypothetical protein
MSNKKAPELFNFSNPEFDAETEKEIELAFDEVDEVEEQEAPSREPIKVQEKIKIKAQDIFEITNKDTGEENPNFIYDDTPPPPGKATKQKVKKPRKPMSEDHKAKLAIAREKAMEARKANAVERKKMKELESEEKELLKTQKVKRVQKLKAEVNDDEISTPTKTTGLSKKDLEDAQLEAIMKYEAIRKKRKEEKKQAQMIEEGKQKMLNNIQRATGMYKYKDGSNRFDNCY